MLQGGSRNQYIHRSDAPSMGFELCAKSCRVGGRLPCERKDVDALQKKLDLAALLFFQAGGQRSTP